jgi:hypothetical protein
MAAENVPGEYDQARGTKFKFKAKSKRSRRQDEEDDSHRSRKRRRSHDEEDSHRSSRPHQHKERKHKYHEPLDDDPSAYDDSFDNNARSSNYLDPDIAFRESLFDAMADDEGAAFWEGVYGQPIHVYPNTKEGPQGELEQMNDEEYAEYVRGKMWEKTHQHVLEERVKREEARKRRRAEEDRWWREDAAREERNEKERRERTAFEKKVEASLRRGEERKARKRWQEAWQRYIEGWERFKEVVAVKSKEEDSLEGKAGRGIIPWPVENGKWKHTKKEDVEDFFRNAVPTDADLSTVLKAERVRWHPDKMQQRFGANKLDEETVRTITAVFQVVDRLWTDMREKKG